MHRGLKVGGEGWKNDTFDGFKGEYGADGGVAQNRANDSRKIASLSFAPS